jgi:hypothetical protein
MMAGLPPRILGQRTTNHQWEKEMSDNTQVPKEVEVRPLGLSFMVMVEGLSCGRNLTIDDRISEAQSRHERMKAYVAECIKNFPGVYIWEPEEE